MKFLCPQSLLTRFLSSTFLYSCSLLLFFPWLQSSGTNLSVTCCALASSRAVKRSVSESLMLKQGSRCPTWVLPWWNSMQLTLVLIVAVSSFLRITNYNTLSLGNLYSSPNVLFAECTTSVLIILCWRHKLLLLFGFEKCTQCLPRTALYCCCSWIGNNKNNPLVTAWCRSVKLPWIVTFPILFF